MTPKKISENLSSILKVVWLEPFKKAWHNYQRLYDKRKAKAILLLGAFFLLVVVLCVSTVLSISNEFSTKPGSTYTDNIPVTNMEIPNTGAGDYFIENFKKSIKACSGVFDNFISYTPDPTGRLRCSKVNTIYCELHFQPSEQVTLLTDGTSIPSTTIFTNILLRLIVPLGIILIIIQGFNFIAGDNREDLKGFFYRILVALILLILTPYLLSLSLMFVNQLSAYFMAGSTLTEFINKFVDGLENTQSQNVFMELYDLIANAVGSGNNPLSFISALPLLIVFGLLLLLLLYISFQFILRFLNLYFLAAIYPLTAIFALHPKTSSIAGNFWKQWTTFLVQQPVFIFGYMIIQQILWNIFDKGISLEVVILFLGMLLFLCTVNLVAARLWGDFYTAVAQNVSAGLAAGLVKSSMIDKPLQYGSNIANMLSQGSIAAIGKKFLNTEYSNPQSTPQSENTTIPKSNKTPANTDSRSVLNKELSGSGYQVNEQPEGQLQVSGNFVSAPGGDQETVKLYTSRNDAISDGNEPSKLKDIHINDLKIQDTSNRKMMNRYNKDIKEFAADNNGHAKEVGLGYRSSDARVAKNMDIGRELNLQKGIQAVAVKNDLPEGDHGITGDNVIKVHAYQEVIKNQNANS